MNQELCEKGFVNYFILLFHIMTPFFFFLEVGCNSKKHYSNTDDYPDNREAVERLLVPIWFMFALDRFLWNP